MKKGILLLLILMSFLSSKAQSILPEADLLNIKFASVTASVKDYSSKNFPVKTGSSTPMIVYNTEIKQFVSRFLQNTNTQTFFRVDYMNDSDFKNKIQNSFSIEVYIKAENNKKMSPVSSMEAGGFGIEQLEKGATQLFFGKSSGDYHTIGSKNVYGDIKSDYHHIVYTYDGTNLKAYLDGVNTDNLSNVGKLRFAPSTAAHWIAIGGDVSGSSSIQREFIGDIALVRMYSSVLSATDINSLYTQVQKRKNLKNIDQLNVVLTKSLNEYSDKNKAKPYIEEGWKLMNSLYTEEKNVEAFLLKIESELGIARVKISDYPKFAVMSDIHVGRSGWQNRLPRAVEVLKEKQLDAVFVVGDVADNGRTNQLNDALKTFSPLSPETSVYYIMGNHDWWEGDGNVFRGAIGQRLNQFVDIKGYPFITISLDSSEKDNQKYIYQSTAQNFLKSALDKADREYPGKPIFVFMHVPLHNTVYGTYPIAPGTETRSNNTEAMKKICNNYPQAIVFSGHSHYPIGDERSIHQEKFTAIHDGNLTATNIEDGLLANNNDRHFSQSLNIAEGCIVSVDGKKDVTVNRIDFKRNEWIKNPWVVKAPHNGSMFTYISARNGGAVPFFATTDKFVISNMQNNSIKVTFPQAKDDDLVHHYLIELINKSGTREQKMNIFSQFFFNSAMPDSLSCTINNLKGIYSDYLVKVTAIDSFYPNNLDHDSNKSKPLTGSAKEMSYANLYMVGSAAPCGWTNTNPEVMTKQASNGIFTWTGFLKKGEFKFLLRKNSWDPSVNPTAATNVAPGSSYDMNITNANNGDHKFNITKDMNCTVTVDSKNWTVKIVEIKVELPLYLVGDATPNKWDNRKATPMIRESEGKYVWSGYLNAGHFKFITKLGTWNSIVPTVQSHENIIPEFKHYISDNYQGDYRFNLLYAGNYTIRVDLNKNTMYVDKDNSDANIYIIGDATPTGWNFSTAMPLSKEGNRLYQWTGHLKAGQFKFITRLGTWNSLVPLPTRNEIINIGQIHELTNDYRGDYRFVISKEANYVVTVDLDNRTLVVNNNGKSLPEETLYTIITQNKSILIKTNTLLDKVSIWNISGQLIDSQKNKSEDFYIGTNLTSGVYIIELIYKGEKAIRKIMVN